MWGTRPLRDAAEQALPRRARQPRNPTYSSSGRPPERRCELATEQLASKRAPALRGTSLAFYVELDQQPSSEAAVDPASRSYIVVTVRPVKSQGKTHNNLIKQRTACLAVWSKSTGCVHRLQNIGSAPDLGDQSIETAHCTVWQVF